MSEFVRLDVSEGVGTIRLDRPKMNALNVQVQEEIRAAAAEATERDDIKAVVVYGGERVFAAGADIKEMADMSYQDMVLRSGGLQSSFTAVARIPKPVVAAVTGYALGGGCELALCADVRFAAEDAVLGQPEILLGAKESIDRGLETDLITGLEIERQQFAALFATEDRDIGMRSFVESGPGKARFVGR